MLLKVLKSNPKLFFFPSILLIKLTDEVLHDPVRRENTDKSQETQPQGTAQKHARVNGRCNLKVITLSDSPANTSSICTAKISMCVSVFMTFCPH